jgi:hypothetical protein
MEKWDNLFENGYHIGDLSELSLDMEEFDKITNEIIEFSKDKEKHFLVQSVSSDPSLPHQIPVSEEEDRSTIAETKGIDIICYNYVLRSNSENWHCLNYLDKITRDIVPKIFAGFTSNSIAVNKWILLYESGHYQWPHSDGHVGECVIIIYFSDPSTYNGSGKLNILKPFPESGILESMDPIKGKYIILEQINHNVRHEVEIVTGDFKRFGFLAQVRKNGDLI